MKNATVTSFQRKSILSLCLQNAAVLAGLLAAACLVLNASAAPVVWSGASGADTNWSNGNNWAGNIPPVSGDDAKFFDAGATNAAAVINNVVDSSFTGTIGSLQYGNTNGFHTTLIPGGVTLNVTGGLTVGTLTDNGSLIVNATITGAGTLNINNAAANVLVDQGHTANASGTQRGILDMSGLNTFTANVNAIAVGTTMFGGANNAQNATGTLKLAQTNVITAAFVGTPIASSTAATPTNAIQIGADNGNAGGINYFYLGQSNEFFMDSIGVGCLKTTSTMLFNSGLNNPVAYFRGTGGATSRVRFWTVGDMSSSGSSSSNCNGTNDFTGGTVDILVDTMSLGRDRQGGNTGSGTTKGTLIFTAGIIDVNTLYVGNQFFTTAGNSNPMAGLVNVNGPGATLKVNTSLVLGNTTVNSTAAQKTAGTLQINGGTVLANAISVGGFSGAANTIAMNGGTLVVSNAIASSAKPLFSFAITNSTLQLNLSGSTPSATVTNFIASGSVTINIGSAPVFPSYPTNVVLIKYFSGAIGGDGYGAFSLGFIPTNAPGAALSNDVANGSIDLVLPTDPRPSITSVSPSYAGSPGDNVTFTVGYTGVKPLTVQWQENGTNVVDGLTGSGSTNFGGATATFSITNAQPSDSGSFAVVVANAFGSTTSSPPTVLVISAGNVAPLVTGPNNQTVIQGNNAIIAASAAGKPVPAVQWQFNGTNLTDGLQGDGSTISGSASSVLTINNVQYPSDQGPYSLIASNSAGMATNGMTLTVIVRPSISLQPQNLVVTNTQSASFSVTASGVPNPTYQWFRNGSPISGANSATYNIPSASPTNIASYYAQISNAAGSTNSASVTLTVNSIGLVASTFAPANGATGICYDTPLYLTFSQAPTLINVGRIRIYSMTNAAAPVDTLDMSLNQNLHPTYAAAVQSRNIGGDTFNSFPVIITGNTAAIYPHLDLLTSNQTYYVMIDDGVFADASGAYFAGISATNVWQFTTKPTGPASLTNLVVAADGSGDFLTVQGAVDSVPANNTTPTFINIRNGFYTEIVDVKSKNNLDFRGQTRTGTLIGYPNNNNVNPSGAPLRAMFVMNGSNCTSENLTITNTTPHGGSQAEAIDVEGTQCIFYNMELDSYQDTFLVHSAGKLVYFQDCLVQGDTDFNWGYGTVYYTNCEVRCLLSGGHLTQPRSPATTNGFGFINCRITQGYPGSSTFDLGRTINTPTSPSEVLFYNCLMADVVTGYASDAGVNMADYGCSNLTATATKTLAYSTHSPSNDPFVIAIQSATNWLYGWQPQVAPNIIGQPASATVSQGQSTNFTVSVTGISPPTFQWLKNGIPIPGATGTSFTIAGAVRTNAGNYSVFVSNASGSVTSSVAVLNYTGNVAPVVANIVTNNVNSGLAWKIAISDLKTAAGWSDPDGDAVTLSSVTSPSANGTNVTSDGTFIYYNGPVTAEDHFTYTVTDGTLTANGTVYLEAVAGTAPSISNPAVNGSGHPTFSGSGIPGYTYGVERATSLSGPWVNAGTVTAGANGSWSFTDASQTNPGTIFYRLYYPYSAGSPPQ